MIQSLFNEILMSVYTCIFKPLKALCPTSKQGGTRTAGQPWGDCQLINLKHFLISNFSFVVYTRASLHFLQLTKLQLGYMVTNVTTVLRLLQGFLSGQNATSRPLTGDLQLAIEILAGCQEYLRKFPPGHSQSPGLPEIVGLASIILTRSMGASPEERKVISQTH